MKVLINGVDVYYPEKLNNRIDEITEFVEEETMGTKIKRCKVFETKRHDLCFVPIKQHKIYF